VNGGRLYNCDVVLVDIASLNTSIALASLTCIVRCDNFELHENGCKAFEEFVSITKYNQNLKLFSSYFL